MTKIQKTRENFLIGIPGGTPAGLPASPCSPQIAIDRPPKILLPHRSSSGACRLHQCRCGSLAGECPKFGHSIQAFHKGADTIFLPI